MEKGIEDAQISREGWEEATGKLGDWKILLEYGENKQDFNTLECYWHEKRYEDMSKLVSKLNISSHPVCVYYKNVEMLENKIPEDFSSFKDIEIDLENSVNGIIAE